MFVRACVPVQVLSGGDGEGASAPGRPQQQVSLLGLLLQQQLSLVTRHVVVTSAVRISKKGTKVVLFYRIGKKELEALLPSH